MTRSTLLLALLFLIGACSTPEPTVTAPQSVVVPPIPELDPALEKHSFWAEEGGLWQLPSGTSITIPPDALVDHNGAPVRGMVDLYYRELHDAIDIYLSGIPMAYGDQHLTTAGSFEIKAFQQDQELFIRDRLSLEVRMASFEGGNDFDFYQLDEYSGDWDNLGSNEPEVNVERKQLVKKIKRMKPGLRFPLNKKYMAFNYQSILDVYFNDNWSAMKADAGLKEKLDRYGLGWTEAEVHQMIQWKKQQVHASLMVWKNISRKAFPDWSKGLYGRLENVKGNLYEYRLASKDSTDFFTVRLLAVMPLKTLFAFPLKSGSTTTRPPWPKWKPSKKGWKPWLRSTALSPWPNLAFTIGTGWSKIRKVCC